MTAVEQETAEPTTETQQGNRVSDLLIKYTELRNAHSAGTITAEEFDRQSRTLRRQIRNAGGSVRELKGEDTPAAEAKPAREPKAKKGRSRKSSRVEAGLDGDPRAQPAGKAHVEWLERVLSGQQDLPQGPHFELEQKSQEAIESEGLFGYGLDVLSDLLPERAIAKFYARFGTNPTWFCLMKPADYSQPTALTLLILGPTPGGEPDAATEAPVDPAVQEEIDREDSDLWNDGEEPDDSDDSE